MNNQILYCSLDGSIPEQYRGYQKIDFSDSNDFRFTIKNQLKILPGDISPAASDLLYFSLFIFAADRKIPRELSNDGWSRDIHLIIPVLCKELWDMQIPLATKILNFLSGDNWTLEFYQRTPVEFEKRARNYFTQLKIKESQIDTVCMFSGGLDSFIGAVDLLAETQNVYFVSHAGGGKGVKVYQDILIESISSKYRINTDHFFRFYAAKVDGIEDTTRTRSLMFFSHAIAIASCLQVPTKLIIPENGLISLNIPLTYSRLGSSSTRTTHPHFLTLFQTLVKNLGIEIAICNPYQFKTKGEMLRECKDQEYLRAELELTMSCSHPDEGRHRKEAPCHCGICFPCLVRRAAVLRAGYKDRSVYRDSVFSKTPTAQFNLNCYRIAMNNHNPKYSFLKIQNSGPIVTNIDQYAALYNRGMKELEVLLEAIHVL